ncbi:hypothetical protein [Streptomyces sp. NPDC059455]|uniref:hypothetical protein n=1 Tax=Streptomyces sp. NPDC059455 TaxID=3346837 RepID=UPI003695A810
MEDHLAGLGISGTAAGRGTVIRPESRWYQPLATTPRHLFVPRWWTKARESDSEEVWKLRDGASDTEAWLRDV